MTPVAKYWDGAAWKEVAMGIETFDVGPIGSILAWPGKTIPPAYVLANGQTLTATAYPDAYAHAQAEVAAGNTLWTVNTGARTFTVPNLADKFLYGQGAKAFGTSGGAETHTLTEAQLPTTMFKQGTVFNMAAAPMFFQFNNNPGGGQPHPNMPPYIVLAFLVKVLGVAVPSVPNPVPVVTSLPASPLDGQEVSYLADATNGVIWRLKYRAGASGSYKWEFIGGSRLAARIDTGQLSITSTSYIAPTGALSLTLPLAGDYDVTIESSIWSTAAGFINAWNSYTVGATAAADNWAAAAGIAGVNAAAVKTTRHIGIAAGAVLAERVRVDSGGTMNINVRRLMAQPVRVG